MVFNMEPSAHFVKVPVVDVHKDNFLQHSEAIKTAMNNASFVAIDCVSYLRGPMGLDYFETWLFV
jgi:hypothetical protein